MPKTNKPLYLAFHAVDVGKSFPAIWEGIFTRVPQDDEVRAKQAKIRKVMNDDLAKQVARGRATSG